MGLGLNLVEGKKKKNYSWYVGIDKYLEVYVNLGYQWDKVIEDSDFYCNVFCVFEKEHAIFIIIGISKRHKKKCKSRGLVWL